MNRNLLLALLLIVVGGGGIYWFLSKPPGLQLGTLKGPVPATPGGTPGIPPEKMTVNLIDTLAAIKERGGFTWDASPKQINGFRNGKEVVLMGVGFGYGEDLGSGAIDQRYQTLEALFLEKGFSLESDVDGKTYQRGKLVCNLIRREVAEKGSSEIEVGCAQLD